jgi:hypothetical protein
VFAAENGFRVQAGFACDVEEAHSDFAWRRRIRIRIGCGSRSLIRIPKRRISLSIGRERTREREDAFEGQNKRGAAQRFKKGAT